MIVFLPPSLHKYFRFTKCIGYFYSNDSRALQKLGFNGHKKGPSLEYSRNEYQSPFESARKITSRIR